MELSASRSPCGERGLKYLQLNHCDVKPGRSPCGERGLKYTLQGRLEESAPSLPVRGAWIEILQLSPAFDAATVAPRAGSVD